MCSLRRFDRRRSTSRRRHRRAHVGQLGRARRRAAARARTAAAAPSSSTASSSRATARVVQRVERRRRRARRREHVLDEVEPLAEVVERGDCPASEQHRVGEAEVVGRHVGQALDLAHGVVAELADDAAVERRELGDAPARGSAASSASSAASVPWSDGTPSGGVAADHSTRCGRARRSVSAGSRPRNENRPQRSACSTDSSRKPSRSPTSFTNAETGVSRSASTSRHTGTTV